MTTNNYKDLDISKATVFDIAKKFPNFAPLLISPETEISDEKFRIFSILVYAENYKISDLKQTLEKEYKTIFPDIFEQI